MYIYELPFEINKEVCRLLDNCDYWKELAGCHMKYSAFDVNEIERVAQRNAISPTNQLFIQWGQLNHRVEELFILLHRMKHIPALQCLLPVVDNKCHKLFEKHSKKMDLIDKKIFDVNQNKHSTQIINGSSNSIPLPVMLIEKGVNLPKSSNTGNKNTPSYQTSSDNSSSAPGNNIDSDDEFIKNVPALPKISYEELKLATDNWSENNLLGRGGFGQVFKGEWKHLAVAVKRLRDNDGRNKELIREMCPNQYRFDDILPLYGYSLGGPEACLVYQLMVGGSLEQRLRSKTNHVPLNWSQRYKIAHGVSRGLQYLHMSKKPLIHGDIKPANILLDQCLMPKIGDFGLARTGPYGDDRTHLKVSKVYGTRPYLPDDYLRSHHLSAAVDVFSFGVVMAEIATALLALDHTRAVPRLNEFLHAHAAAALSLASLEDPSLSAIGDSQPALCEKFLRIALHCTRPKSSERPIMLAVFKTLDTARLPTATSS